MRLRGHLSIIGLIIALSLVMLWHLSVTQAQDSHAVLLPESAAAELAHLCSRESPKIDGTWVPSATVLATMESHLDQIADLSSSAMKKSRQKDPHEAYRQYIGVLIGGQRYVYINGFCYKPDGSSWNKHLSDVCDGGECHWGVLYNVQSGKFSDLRANGNA